MLLPPRTAFDMKIVPSHCELSVNVIPSTAGRRDVIGTLTGVRSVRLADSHEHDSKSGSHTTGLHEGLQELIISLFTI